MFSLNCFACFLMDYKVNHLIWKVLCWNIRGLNSDDKQLALYNKIMESGCAVACVQETKKEDFDRAFIKKCCPRQFDSFTFSPSVGASGGILVVWKSSILEGTLVQVQRFGLIISFKSVHSQQKWTLVVVYGPCHGEQRDLFVQWLYDLVIPTDELWLFMGDFNFIRSEEDRNRPGGDVNDMFLFNELIDHLGLLELPIQGRSFTWSNMQESPLLVQLDWFFTSANWISIYPNTVVNAMARPTSDHVPCIVSIDTVIPKAQLFRFENFWVDQPGFYECVKRVWDRPTRASSSSAVLTEKMKALRVELKKWKMGLSKLKSLISKCSLVILYFDVLEEDRPLFIQEANFRKIVKKHYEDLLRCQYRYWRKRCTIRWMKLGEENSKFFHAMATERYRRNTMASLQMSDGHIVTDHGQMASIAWDCYKQRMGTSNGINMLFDLNSLVKRVDGLEELTEGFTTKEMDDLVKHMAVDKAPGPDGFNGMFLKKCWPIIKQDFYNLASDFHQRSICLENINSSFITLVTKKPSPEQINDYRPISLTNTCLKFLTKMVADRLQGRILECIHKNQYGFIKGKSIHDCLAWSFEYIHQCKASGRPVIILKLDFEKAFDSIEHECIYQVLRHMGFPEKFIYWVKIMLETGTSSVLVNGVPGRKFKCRRGVTQGDPLSPLLFALGAEILQYVINDLKDRGLIRSPIDVGEADFPVVQYADDTLLIMEADPCQLDVLKKTLHEFTISTGLCVNYHKSCMLPINISAERVQQLAEGFGCIVGSFPFTYLGLPMGTTRPRLIDMMPLVTRMERRLTASSSLLAYGGRLQLIGSYPASMSVYFLCSLEIPPGILKQIYRIIRKCLWRGNNPDSKKQSLASLDMICKPRKSGGLGIVDFHKQNQGLLMKHLHKFFNKEDVPWVKLVWRHYPEGVPQSAAPCGSFWWRDVIKLAPIYFGFCIVQVGSGDTVRFWSDCWNGRAFHQQFPRLFSFALNPDISVKEVLSSVDMAQLFALPLSVQAFEEFQALQLLLEQVNVNTSTNDEWKTIWKDGIYSSSRYYHHCFKDQHASKVYSWIWESKVMLRIKVFAWLLVSDRLNTRDMLRRRHWNVTEELHCVMCPTHETEDWMHLFFHCSFSMRVWNYLQIQWEDGGSFEEVFKSARSRFRQPFLLKWSSLRAGTSGNKGMRLSFKMCFQLSGLGKVVLFMSSPCIRIG